MKSELEQAGDAVVEAVLRWAEKGRTEGVWEDEFVHQAIERYMEVRDRSGQPPVV